MENRKSKNKREEAMLWERVGEEENEKDSDSIGWGSSDGEHMGVVG